MDAKSPENQDLLVLGRERVRIEPAPDWIASCSYDPDFAPKITGPLSYLLIEKQVHAERHQTYVRMVVRLETMQAVQHESQWRLAFEPQTQFVTLHSIKVRRGLSVTEHASLDRLQFLRREAGLEGCVIDGWITLLLLLEDVSVGDVLEWCYTISTKPRLLPDSLHCFFSLPAGVEVAKYHFQLRHAEHRNVKWKSASQDLVPSIATEEAVVRCSWTGERFTSPDPEQCLPMSQLAFPWIQVSDCSDWQTVARAVVDAWKQQAPGDGLSKFVEEINAFAPDLLTRVNRAIELVQDRFRYLSVNIEFGGQIPSAADDVIRRRYGDCKDLAFLLVQLLRALGVPARPVLVNAFWRGAVASLLPAPDVFNHVIVEYQIENETRWVDATMKAQGGGALNRCVPDFEFGLPIDPAAENLCATPARSLPSSSFEIKESFILDTAGKPSYLSVVMTAKGNDADMLRWEFENEGVDSIARKRQQLCANKYAFAARVGSLQYRDNREQNEFVTAEVFEIDNFLKPDRDHNGFVFFPSNEAIVGLLCPSAAPRRGPFALPFPCNRVHIVEINFPDLNVAALPVFQFGNDYFSFSRRSKALSKFFRLTFSFSTRAAAVPPEHAQEHRRNVESVWRESSLQLRLATGYGRMRRPSDFGALPNPTNTPPPANPASSTPKPVVAPLPSTLATEEVTPATTVTASNPIRSTVELAGRRTTESSKPTDTAPTRSREHRSDWGYSPRRHFNKRSLWAVTLLGCAIASFIGAGILSINSAAETIVGVVFIFAILSVAASVVLAIKAWGQCARHPGRYRHGRSISAMTAVVGSVFGLILLPGFIHAIVNAFPKRTADQTKQVHAEILRFERWNFMFYPLLEPWKQTDARAFGPAPVVAFTRPDPMYFTICVIPIPSGIPNKRAQLVEQSKANLRRMSISCQLVAQRDRIHNGVMGFQVEMEANVQGHNCYFVHWLTETNDVGYQLAVWGPVDHKDQVTDEADRVFSNFEFTNP